MYLSNWTNLWPFGGVLDQKQRKRKVAQVGCAVTSTPHLYQYEQVSFFKISQGAR